MDIIQPKSALTAGGCNIDRDLVQTVIQIYLVTEYAIVGNASAQVVCADGDVIHETFPVWIPTSDRGRATVRAPNSDKTS